MSELLSEKVAIAVTRSLLSESRPPYDAIKTILSNAGCKPRVTTNAIMLSLQRWESSRPKMRMLHDIDALAFAIDLANEHPPRLPLIEKVSLAAAQAGFVGRFPEFPQKHLSRNPSEEEITALVSAYVEDKAVRSEDVERKLERMAYKFLHQEIAEREVLRIREFVDEYEMHIE